VTIEITEESTPRSRPVFGLNRSASATCLIVVAAMATLWSDVAVGQSAAPASQSQLTNNDLSKEAENPVTLTITIPLRYEADFNDGPYCATKDTFELDQAVVPFRLNDDWSLITRTKLPAYSQPPKKLGDSRESGLGNGYTTFFLSSAPGEGFYWGVGPVLIIRPRPTKRSGSINGVLARPSHSSPRTLIVLGYWALSSIHLVIRGPSTEQRPNQQPVDQSVHQLPFRRWLVDRILAQHHRELVVEDRPGLDRSDRGRDRQDVPFRQSTCETGD
jgi:hypothetical protein